MRLESIVLHGFKSFGERTEVKVLPGITAIVGPNGCGKCLEGSTPVILADGRLVAIRDLVERQLEEAPVVQELDDGQAAFNAGAGFEVLSLNPATLRLEPRPVQAFIRRTAPAYLLRVQTRSGREVVTTHYHPLFGLEQGSLRVLTADQLTTGMRIAVPRCLPAKPRPGEAMAEALLGAFRLEDRICVPASPALAEWLHEARRRAGSWPRLGLRVGVPANRLRGIDQGQAVNIAALARVAAWQPPIGVPFDRITASRRGTTRVPEEVDGRLARFLGYLIAEGRVTSLGQVRFVNSDRFVSAEFALLAQELFGLTPRRMAYKATVADTLLFSRALCLLLDRVFKISVDGGSATKAVPPQVMAGSDEIIGEFLSGLFEGDAFILRAVTAGKTMPHLEYVTASRRLAEDVVTLLLRLGVFALVRPKWKTASNTRARRRRCYYSVYVYGVEQVQRLAARLRFAGAKQARLDAVRGLATTGNPNLDVIPGVTSLVRVAIAAAGINVKALRAESPRLAAYAEQRCEASRAGLREVAALISSHGRTPEKARPLLRQLEALADSDLYWDEVVAIERVNPPEPWVYDLTVADTHNFVAGNLIVHNSNISDAVRWALGEQSAKSLRGQRMEDLIFHGSASRKPVGMAEVELSFSNDGALAVPWSEIAVSRRLYRTGESEYLLNKTPTRLRDLLDLFAGTGANPRAYSVMDQDRLNHVLTAKPHERRIFIEEAAGIARYKQQRDETQGKLEAAHQNLVRVKDVMDEVRRQLGSLERQARKAQQYKALEQERRDLRLTLVAADHAALLTEAQRLETELAAHREREGQLRVRQSQADGRQATLRQTIQESDHRLGDLRQGLQKVQAELERLLERREQMGVQLREAADESVRLDEEIGSTTERLTGIVGEREATRAALAEAEQLVADRTRAALEAEGLVERHRTGLADERDRLEALRLEQIRIAAERTDLTRSAGELRERGSQLARRAERLAAELAEAEAEAQRLEGDRTQLEAARDRIAAALATLTAERERLASLLLEQENMLGEAESRLAEARLTLAARQSSRQALEGLEAAREGYASGVRAVFAEAGGEVVGIVGTVADLLDVPRELEWAVEAVLGERLEWVVVERFEHARAAVAYLSAQDAGAATFLPLEGLPDEDDEDDEEAPDNRPPRSSRGELTWLSDEVRAQAPGLVHYLLGGVAVVEDLDEAEARWRRSGARATYVTLAGEVLGPTGRLRGGTGEGVAEPSLLARKRQIRELDEEVARLEATAGAAQEEVARLSAEATTLRERLAQCDQQLGAYQADRLTGEKDLEQAIRELERVHRHLETVRLEAGQVALEGDETKATLARLEQRIAAARQAEAGHESTIAGLRESLEAGQQRETELVTGLTACRVGAASVTERVEALGRELGRIDQMETELTERLAQAQVRQGQLGARHVWLGEERERTDVTARAVAVERDRAEGEARAAAERHEALLGELRLLEQEIRGVESEIGRVIGAIHDIELAATERRVRREELVQDAFRTFGVDEAALRAQADPRGDLGGLRARIVELDERLAAIGPVNLVADEEYRELDERLTFLHTQHDDLTASIKDLEKALRGMTRTAQERFQQAFEQINQDFARIFERLFEGGRAELRMVDAEEGGDPLDTGVDLMAQPRGKRLQSVTLLSGGERALTGLALLFAIFYYRPSPFCVLDEADAPLDDANIYRFLRVLRELTSRTQFLVITHNRRTMEAADLLYGVTMEEPGLSKLVSVRLAPNG